jgi:predicted Zn-dependent protease
MSTGEMGGIWEPGIWEQASTGREHGDHFPVSISLFRLFSHFPFTWPLMLSRDDAKTLIDRIIRLSQADEVQVTLDDGEEKNIRFADNRITTSGSADDLSVRVSSAFGKRSAVTSTNDITDEGLERAVRQSEALARLAPENPERMPLLGPQHYTETSSYFRSTANATAEARAQAAGIAIGAARRAGDLTAAGLLITNAGMTAIGNNKGLFAYRSSTSVDFSETVRTADGTGSGWAGANHPDWSKINVAHVSEVAIQKARLSRNPRAIEPGEYTVILEPQAAADLVALMDNAFDSRSAEEGRSAFAKQGGGTRVGERIVDERVTMISDPADPQLLGSPFDVEGMPLGRQVWIENGVLKNLYSSRFWAQKQGRQPTGNASSLKMSGGDQTLDQLIATTDRGVLVTRFWYIRPVNPRTLLYTGLTRDGTFLIENGKIVQSVQNMRFNESPLFILRDLDAIGQAVRVSNGVVMPSLRVRNFTFSSLSDAV